MAHDGDHWRYLHWTQRDHLLAEKALMSAPHPWQAQVRFRKQPSRYRPFTEIPSLFGVIRYQTFSLLAVVSFGCAQGYLKP